MIGLANMKWNPASCSNLYPIPVQFEQKQSRRRKRVEWKSWRVHKQEPTNPTTAAVAWSPKSWNTRHI